MITIEQLENEILSKSGLITEGLILFQENIDNLGSVIGKDPRHVYDVLVSAYDSVMGEYNMTTRRNVEILSGYVVRLDKILNVLTDVTFQIQNMKTAQENGTISEVAEEIGNAVDTIASDIEQVLNERGVTVERDYVSMAIIGAGSYSLMRILGFGRITSLAVAAGSSYMLVGKNVKEIEKAVTQV
jgi:hypothetical protein